LSFLHAAEELAVTPGAVSRQIQGLEALLGAKLFLRQHRHVELTRTGREYLDEIRTPLARVAAATARVQGADDDGTVSICANPSFAIRWFIPRWGRFYDRHPEIDVRLTTSLVPVDFARDDYDLAIQVLPEGAAPSGLAAHKITEVETFPIAAPAQAARLRRPADLASATLLHCDPRPDDWPRWLRHAGIEGVAADKGPRFESLNLATQAAIEGLGVAIGIEALVRDDLAQGRLVRPFATVRRSARPMQLLYPEAKATRPSLRAFRDWLMEEAAA
jgi:LysR family glycine cleavage system transcriptional activator